MLTTILFQELRNEEQQEIVQVEALLDREICYRDLKVADLMKALGVAHWHHRLRRGGLEPVTMDTSPTSRAFGNPSGRPSE